MRWKKVILRPNFYRMINNVSREKPNCGLKFLLLKSGPTAATTCDTSLGSSVDPGVAPTKDASGSHQAPLSALHERNGGDQVTATGAGEGTTWNDHGPEEMAG